MRALRLPSSVLLLALGSSCSCDDEVFVRPGAIVGVACDEDTGAPKGGAVVTLEDERGKRDLISAADGSYTFVDARPGPAVVRVDAREFDVVVFSGEDAFVTDSACRDLPGGPGGGAIDGWICNRHTGALVTNADVYTSIDDQIWHTTTDADGRFLLEGLPVGAHVVTVQGTGFERSFLVDVVDGEVSHIDAGEGCAPTSFSQGTVSGSLCDPADPLGALAGASVTAVDASGFRVADITDIDGKFFLNSLAPGPVVVDIVRRPDVNRSYADTVVAGADTVVVNDVSCNGGPDPDPDPEPGECSYDVVATGSTELRPVDIIFVIDDSPSMNDDNDAVQANINTFSSSIGASGVDYRVVLIGSTNVPPPLGGSSRFLQVDESVGSNEPLEALVDHYPTYAGFLREDSLKHFIAITDDESDMGATTFSLTVATWQGFSGFTFHSIVAYGSDPEDGCSTGAGYGHQYMTLSTQTGGVTAPICGANYSAVFSSVVEAVSEGSLPCTIALDAPAGATTSTTGASVTYRPGDGSAPEVMNVSYGPCTAVAEGWRFDSSTSPSEIAACPATCSRIARDGLGTLTARFDCSSL